MDLFRRNHWRTKTWACVFGSVAALGSMCFAGCASPGPPRAPSLELPQPVSDLAAQRIGDTVELRFTLPHLSTDKTPLVDPKHPHKTLEGVICRSLDKCDCVTIAGIKLELTTNEHAEFIWRDQLPIALIAGTPRLISYRAEFLSPTGRSAGKSNPALTASGPAPAVVTALHAEGTRGGILLSWASIREALSADAAEDVLLERTALAARPVNGKPLPREAVMFNANAAHDRTLDATVVTDEPYRYTAARRAIVRLGSRTVELRSQPSAAVEITLKPIYPPATPSGLIAVGFQPSATSGDLHFAVDLIWQPVSESGITAELAAPFAGYNLYRETVDNQGHGLAPRIHLNTASIPQPSFHDTTAEPATRYRYSVTSIDGRGNESHATTVILEPSTQ